jgi:MFS family permease
MLLWSGEALSQLGSQASTVAFPLLVLALTHSPAKAGVVGLAKWLPLSIAALPAGVAADRFDRKRLMIGSDLLRGLLLASIPVALAFGRPSFAQIAAIAFCDGFLFALRYVCERGALPHVVEREHLPSAVVQNEARMFAANIAGPPLGGILFALARALPFIADAVSYLASMATVALTRANFQSPRSAAEARGRFGGTGDGLVWLWRHPFFRSAALLFAAGNPLYTGLYLLAILLAKRHGASSGAVGAMFAVVGAGGLAGAVLANRLRGAIPAGAVLIAEGWLLALVVPVLFAVHAPLLIGLVVALCEFPTPLSNSLVSGHRVALTPDHLRGRVQAAGTLVTMSLAWLGPLTIGLVFQQAGATATLALVSAWALLLAVATTLTPSVREGPPSLWTGAETPVPAGVRPPA